MYFLEEKVVENKRKLLGMSEKTFRLVLSAVMIGLATVLSLIKVYQMPLGGSVTLCSMLPILLIGYKYGAKWGMFTGFVYAIVQLLLDLGAVLSWGLTPTAVAASFVFDYLVAFSVLGLAGIYGKGFVRYILGMVTAMLFRFVSHVISGVTAYGSFLPKEWHNHLWLYSVVYNGTFILPDLIICLFVGAIIYKPLKKFIEE
jgi:thiamine transporter